MRTIRLTCLTGLLLALLITATDTLTAAGWSSGQDRAYAPSRLDVVQDVAARCPGLILRDHAFTDAVATVLWLEDTRWGRNGKRGNANDPSHDALAYRTDASPLSVAIVDIIGAAGSPPASPAWIDVTAETIRQGTTGVWVRPSGVLPACLSGGSEPAPPAVTHPPTTGGTSDAAIAAELAELRRNVATQADLLRDISADISALKATAVPPLLSAYIEDMIGTGPAGDPAITPNHITDLLQRIDALRARLDAIDAWLRGRAVLRY